MFGSLVSLMTSSSRLCKRQVEGDTMAEAEAGAMCSEDGGRVTSQGHRRPLAAEKETEADPPLEPPEETSPANTLTVAQ